MSRPVRVVDYGEVAAAYAAHRQVHPGVLRDLVETGGVTADSRVLEVGCGTGNYIVALVSATGCQGWGVDPAAGMLEVARTRPGGVRFGVGRAEATGAAEAAFDVIFSVDVVHNVGDLDAAMREAARVLRPGGRTCTVTDSEWVIRHRQPLTAYFPETAEVDLARYPGIPAIREAMGRAGLVAIEDRTVEFSYALADARPYRERVFSCLRLIAEDAHRRGLARMERDLRRGPIPCVSRYTLVWGSRLTAGPGATRKTGGPAWA